MSGTILKYINYGYSNIEPVIISMIALNKNFMLIGKHGTGKTKLAKFLSEGYKHYYTNNDKISDNFVFYDATKDDLISIAGIPSPESMKSGELDFIKHKRSIWDKTTIVVDEITRASKENQNMWLEILEERTCFGLPLKYKSLIATANPESYASANQLDEALLDRFYAVLPVPSFQTGVKSEDVMEIVKLNFNDKDTTNKDQIIVSLSETYQKIQDIYKEFKANEILLKSISEYTSQVISQLLIELGKRKDKIYISPRSYGNYFPDSIIAVASYFHIMGEEKPLIIAAEESLKYCIATKFGIDVKLLQQIHNNFKTLLEEKTLSEKNELRKKIARLSNIEDKIRFLDKNSINIEENLKTDEINYFVGSIIKESHLKKDYLIDIFRVINNMSDKFNNIKENLKGTLLINFHNALNDFILISRKQIKTNHIDEDTLEIFRKIENLAKNNELLTSTKKDIIKLNKFILKREFQNNPDYIFTFLKELNV